MVAFCNNSTERDILRFNKGLLFSLKLTFIGGCQCQLVRLATPCRNFSNYRPQTKLREGNVFRSVCQEFCPQGDVSQDVLGGGCLPGGCLPRHPPDPEANTPRWAVCILLECILVSS